MAADLAYRSLHRPFRRRYFVVLLCIEHSSTVIITTKAADRSTGRCPSGSPDPYDLLLRCWKTASGGGRPPSSVVDIYIPPEVGAGGRGRGTVGSPYLKGPCVHIGSDYFHSGSNIATTSRLINVARDGYGAATILGYRSFPLAACLTIASPGASGPNQMEAFDKKFAGGESCYGSRCVRSSSGPLGSW